MTITPAAVIYAVLSLAGLLLGLALLGLTANAGEARRGHTLVLGLVMGQAIFLVRLLAWPCFYWVLKSYVPLVPGAMCVYGVALSARAVTGSIEVLEPICLLVTGAGFVLLGVYRAGGAAVSPRLILRHLVAIGLCSSLASAAGLYFLFFQKTTQEVSCCSVVFDQPNRFTAQTVAMVSTHHGAQVLLSLTQSVAIALLCLQLVLLTKMWSSRHRLLRRLLPGLALLHLVAAVMTLFECLAPKLTGVDGHHCAYCLATCDTFPAPLAYSLVLLLGLATFIPVWTWWVRRMVPNLPEGAGRRWQWLSILCLVAYWASLLIPYYR